MHTAGSARFTRRTKPAIRKDLIAIAHRLSTLRHFDRIIVMDHGRIVDDGTPFVLAHRPGPYRDLLDKQRMDVEPELRQAA